MRTFVPILKSTSMTLLAVTVVAVLFGYGFYRWRERTTSDCPILAWLTPISHKPVQANDSLKIEIGGAWGITFTTQFFGDGRVYRDSAITEPDGEIVGCPLHQEDKLVHIAQEQASALIAEARDSGFCRLCAFYRHHGTIYDAPVTDVTLTLDGVAHRVGDHAGDPPPIFRHVLDQANRLQPPFPAYAMRGSETPRREQECEAFEGNQEKLNAQIRHARQ